MDCVTAVPQPAGTAADVAWKLILLPKCDREGPDLPGPPPGAHPVPPRFQ